MGEGSLGCWSEAASCGRPQPRVEGERPRGLPLVSGGPWTRPECGVGCAGPGPSHAPCPAPGPPCRATCLGQSVALVLNCPAATDGPEHAGRWGETGGGGSSGLPTSARSRARGSAELTAGEEGSPLPGLFPGASHSDILFLVPTSHMSALPGLLWLSAALLSRVDRACGQQRGFHGGLPQGGGLGWSQPRWCHWHRAAEVRDALNLPQGPGLRHSRD